MEDFILIATWASFFWSCLRVAATIVVAAAVGIAVAAIVSAAGGTPIAGAIAGFVAAGIAGGITYYAMGPYKEKTTSPPPIKITYQELKVPIVFFPLEGSPQKATPFQCKIRNGNDWIVIQKQNQKELIDEIVVQFKALESKRVSNDKHYRKFFAVEVYKQPFPGDSILDLIDKKYRDVFIDAKDTYQAFDKCYEEDIKK